MPTKPTRKWKKGEVCFCLGEAQDVFIIEEIGRGEMTGLAALVRMLTEDRVHGLSFRIAPQRGHFFQSWVALRVVNSVVSP